MTNRKKGISLIALIITIVVLIIIVGATMQSGLQRAESAKLSKHNTNISTTQEEVESYYYGKDEELPIVNQTPYTIIAGSTLEAEITKNGEQEDRFYIVDVLKLGKVAGEDGKGIGDDIYIVSATRHTVYYVKGTTIKGITYHGLISNNDVKLAQITAPPTATPAPTGTPTPTPGAGNWDGTSNSPKLAAGMRPIRFTGSGNDYADLVGSEQSNANNEWYDYRNTGVTANKWANARLAEASMFVWIPRFTYKISPDPDNVATNRSATGTIDIKFSNGTTDYTADGYKVHPAFYWGGWNIPASAPMSKQTGNGEKEILGIWVAKFEASPREGTSESLAGDNVTTKHVKVVPNVKSWRNINLSTMYAVCKNMQDTADYTTYGISNDRDVIDAHMMKNSEWGAVAYLSRYARVTEVGINSNAGYITANADLSAYKAQSTTNTEYGIYDMSGSACEYVASYVETGNIAVLSTYGGPLYSETQGKYKDIFSPGAVQGRATNYAASNKAYGYAIYETSSSDFGSTSWFGDYSNFPFDNQPFFLRGGYSGGTGLFGFDYCTGEYWTYFSFRPCIAVQ